MKFSPKILSEICKNCIHCYIYSYTKNLGICKIKKGRDYKESKEAFDRNEYSYHPEKLPSGSRWPFIYNMSRSCFVELDNLCDEKGE